MALSDVLPRIGHTAGELQVRLSNQIIHLLSEQMYSSPLKAIEELVVNAYDADAQECRIGIPNSGDGERFIVVFDDGSGMDYGGLEQLWHVGESPKAHYDVTGRRNRKVIGKFGIGKLATHAIANRITYLTRRSDRIFHVACDFRDFKSAPEGADQPVPLSVHEVDDPRKLRAEAAFDDVCEAAGVDAKKLTNGNIPTWTLCVLESLKEKAADLKVGRLRWVLRTAMPLRTDFATWVNGERVERTAADFHPIVEFKVGELSKDRLETLNKKIRDPLWRWRVADDGLVSDVFLSGIRGEVIVTERSLVTGKSADIDRSHGFFVRVRERLVNQSDELFGLHALTHATFNFFRADLQIDDLNSEVTAPREGLESGVKRTAAAEVMLALFNEARARKEKRESEQLDRERRKLEHERSYVPVRLVEHPIADTLAIYGNAAIGSEADEGWFFMEPQGRLDLARTIEQLYTERRRYKYAYLPLGKTERVVKFDPASAKFTLNEDHELVRAYSDEPRARQLLEDVVTSEVLLEVYMREAEVDPYIIGEVLERRDMLMRSLAQDRVYSLEAISQSLLDSIDNEYDLEIALVAAARALGFNAKHISNAGEPDGLARFNDFRAGEAKITLEAKSSQGTPSLSALDFAGLAEHKKRYQAQGCLLVAPSYPGQQRRRRNNRGVVDEWNAVNSRAEAEGVSCWTVADLARVVRSTESHQITATQVLDIVRGKFKPIDVSEAVEELLTTNNMRALYREILNALKALGHSNRLPKSVRTVQHVSAALALQSNIQDLDDNQVRSALVEMGNASRGILRISDNNIILAGELEELERRVSAMTGESGQPRRLGTFRDDGNEGGSGGVPLS